jgi:hypothetical protein
MVTDLGQYGAPHRRMRAAYAAVLPLPCVFCGRVIPPGAPFDLDHQPGTTDRYRGVACPSCNRADGARRGNRARQRRGVRRMELRNVCAGLDLAWDRSRTALAIAGHADHPTAGQVVAAWLWTWPGVAAPEAIGDILSTYKPKPEVTVNGSGALRVLAEPLERFASVHEATAQDMADAHGRFLDTVNAGLLKIPEPNPLLDAAVQRAQVRPLTEGTALDKRRAEADLSPLVAVELAVWQVVRGAGTHDIMKSFL